MQEPHQNSKHQGGDPQQVQYCGPTNIRCHYKI